MQWPTFKSEKERRRFEARVVAQNARLAYKIATHYNPDIPYEDRCQEALEGIVNGIRKYDPDREGANFRSCIIGWIRQRLMRMNTQKPGTYSMPIRVWQAIFRGDEEALALQLRSIPIDRCHEPAGRNDSEDEAIRRVVRAQLKHLVDKVLPPKEAWVIYRHFGLDGSPPMLLSEIGRAAGVSREWIRQLRNRALKKLRDELGREDILL